MNEAFPVFDASVEVVFDLAGSLSKDALSISSAIAQSDVVVVPICNEVKAINAGLNTLGEVLHFNQNVIVVVTKLEKRFKGADFANVRDAVHNHISADIPVLPLKASAVFDRIFEDEQSIRSLMTASALARYQYREVAEQFDDLYSLIDSNYAG